MKCWRGKRKSSSQEEKDFNKQNVWGGDKVESVAQYNEKYLELDDISEVGKPNLDKFVIKARTIGNTLKQSYFNSNS